MPSACKARQLVDRYFRLLLILPIAALVMMMMITVADVFMRYVFNAPIGGTYDLVEVCLLISVYLALPAVILEAQPIVINLIDGLVPPGAVAALKAIAALTAITILCFMFWSMLNPAKEAYEFGDVKPELGFPLWILWVFALFGILNSIAAAIVTLFDTWPTKAGQQHSAGGAQ
jgi:TRAP-type C4-dicarboxylate transport system permease small subunit